MGFDPRNLALSACAGLVVMLVLSWIWHVLVMDDYFRSEFGGVMRADYDYLFIVLGYVVLALLMAYIYPLGYQSGPPEREGLRFGVLIGLLWVLPASLVGLGGLNLSLNGIMVDAVWHLLEQGAGGVAIASAYQRLGEQDAG